MAAINFPASPSPGDKHPTTGSINGKVWAWDGTSWNIVSTDGSVTIIDDTARSFAFDVTYTNVAGNYNVVGTDRNGEVNGLNPTITVNEEDTLIFNVNATSHPFYLVWAHGGSSDQVGGGQGVNTASNQGTVNGTVTWVTDVGDGVALPQGGLFYYQCGNHPSMYGTIKVLLKKTSDGASHIHDLIDLDDTPSAYDNGKYLKSTATGTEWATVSGGTTYDVVDDQADGLAPQLPASHGGKFLKADGSWEVPAYIADTTYGVFQGTDSGLVPASDSGTSNKYLRSDGTWQVVSSGGGADGNDYVTGAALGTGADAKVLTLSFGDTSLNKTVDLASINTDTIYEIKALSNNNDFNIQIDASGSGTDSSVRFETGDNITLGYINAGHVKISATDTTYSNFTTSSSGLVPVSPGGTTKYLRADGTWQEVSGGGGGSADGNDYITSAQLGTGANSKVLTFGFTDTSLNFNVDLASIDTDTDTTYNVVSINAAGLAPQLPLSSSGKYLKDDGTWDTPPDTDTNTTYSNFTTSSSGLVPVSPGGTTKYLRADGTWQTITSGGNDGNDYVTNLSLDGTTLKAEFATSSLDQEVDLASINTDTTYGVVSNSVDGLAPQLPSSPSGKFLRDDATWQTPPDTDTNTNYYANDFQFNSSTNVLSIGYAGNSSLDTTVTINPSGGGDIPSGTAMLFAQGSAPTGWTKSTSHNNKALRVVSGSGGSSGGSVGFTSAFQNHTVSISGSDTVSISDSDTVSISGSCTGSQSIYWNTTQAWLSVNQMPSHQHEYDVPRGSSGGQYGFQDTANSGSSGTQKVAGTGGSSYHTHAIIMQYVNGSNFDFEGSDTVSLSGSDTVSISGSDDVNLAVQYVDVIICTKG